MRFENKFRIRWILLSLVYIFFSPFFYFHFPLSFSGVPLSSYTCTYLLYSDGQPIRVYGVLTLIRWLFNFLWCHLDTIPESASFVFIQSWTVTRIKLPQTRPSLIQLIGIGPELVLGLFSHCVLDQRLGQSSSFFTWAIIDPWSRP